jgi:translation initiation factor 2 beta subunit (eIF-2beta)/eIF-5
MDEFGEEYFVNGLKRIFDNVNSNKNKTVVSFKDIDFKDSVLVFSEKEIQNAIDENDDVSLVISRDFDNHRIKNIYQEYASSNVRIYSQYFFENLDEAHKFIDLCNEIHQSHVSLS